SFARNFMASGAQAVVMTLWKVDDAASSELMKAFYALLAEGMNVRRALSQARRNFLSQADSRQAHPYYWAAYVVNGNATLQAVSTGISWIWMALIGGGILMGIGLGGYFRVVRRGAA
ncbi:MAG: CHAT domain-containing protein, partial [Bacteroidota bacterium]